MMILLTSFFLYFYFYSFQVFDSGMEASALHILPGDVEVAFGIKMMMVMMDLMKILMKIVCEEWGLLKVMGIPDKVKIMMREACM